MERSSLRSELQIRKICCIAIGKLFVDHDNNDNKNMWIYIAPFIEDTNVLSWV